MSKVDAATPRTALLPEDSPESGAPGETPSAGLASPVLDRVVAYGHEQVDDVLAAGTTAWEWATNDDSDEKGLVKLIGSGGPDLDQKLSALGDAKLDWLLSHLSDEERESVLSSLDASGLAKRTAGRAPTQGAPRGPTLYEVNDRQPPALRDFLHGENLHAARGYQSAYGRYVDDCKLSWPGRPAVEPQPPAAVKEPGTGAPLDGPMPWKLARSPADFAASTLDDAEDALTLEKQMKGLAVGEELQMSVSGDLSVECNVGASGKLRVRRGDDGFRVSSELGASGGFKVNDQWKASFGAAAGLEVHCASAEEAERAARLMTPAGWSAMSRDDLAFLKAHASGVDFKGSAAAKLSAQAPVGIAANLKSETSYHLDFEKKTLTVTDTFEGQGELMMGHKYKPAAGVPGTKWSLQTKPGDGLKADLTVKRTVQLPGKLTVQQLRDDPLGAMGALGAVAPQIEKADATVTARVEGARGEDSLAAEVELKASWDQLAGMVSGFVVGNPVEAMDRLAREGEVEARLERQHRTGFELNLKAGLGGASGSVGVASQKVRHEVKTADLSSALKQVLGR